jgi:hypothetical protein
VIPDFAPSLSRARAGVHLLGAVFVCVISASTAHAQSNGRAIARGSPRDTTRADSLRTADSSRAREPRERAPREAPQGQGPANPRLLPDISAVGDVIADLSPDGTTQEDGTRFGVREIELALQAAVDPFFRGDVFLGVSDEEGLSIEQAYLTATALPWGIEARVGRFLMPLTKINGTHRHDLHAIEYPLAVQAFLGPEGLKGTGVYASRVFSPFGFYQEVILTAVDRVAEHEEGLETAEPVNKELNGLGYGARLRNYWDLSEAANIELSGSVLTGKREQPVSFAGDVTAVATRQTTAGVDLTFRWRPLQQGLYKSFIFQTEFLYQRHGDPTSLPEPSDPQEPVVFDGIAGSFDGFYAFARWQLTRRGHVGARFDAVESPVLGGGRLRAASGYYEFFPSDFSKLLVGYERLMPPNDADVGSRHRILLQASFSIGPHRPHPF